MRLPHRPYPQVKETTKDISSPSAQHILECLHAPDHLKLFPKELPNSGHFNQEGQKNSPA